LTVSTGEAKGADSHDNQTTSNSSAFSIVDQERINSATVMQLKEDDDLRFDARARFVNRNFSNALIATLERKQHPHRWESLISPREEVEPSQPSPILKDLYGKTYDRRKNALKEVFASIDTEKSAVHWQRPLILAAIDAAIKAPEQIHLVHTWLDCIQPHCPRRQVRFQRLLCDSLAVCPPEVIPDLADKVLNYLLLNKTKNHESNLFWFFYVIKKHAPWDFANAYLQNNIALLSVFCENDAPLAELPKNLLRARLCKLYPEHHDVLQAMPYSDQCALNARHRLTTRFATLEALLPNLAEDWGEVSYARVLQSLLAENGLAVSLYLGTSRPYTRKDDITSLNWAAAGGYIKIVQCLLAAGAAVNAQDKDEKDPTPLLNPEGYRSPTALMDAAAEGHFEVVQCLLEAGAAVNLQDYYGKTALMSAAKAGCIKTVQCLLDAGAAMNSQDNCGVTALMQAAIEGHFNVVQCLLDAGAKVDLQDKAGWTALIWAVRNGHLKVVHCLLAAGANLDLQDKGGWTALMQARSKSRTEIVALLKAHDNQGTSDFSFIDFIMWRLGQLGEWVLEAVEAPALPSVGGQPVNVNNAGGHSFATNPSRPSYLPAGPARGGAAPAEATGTTQGSNLPQRTANRL